MSHFQPWGDITNRATARSTTILRIWRRCAISRRPDLPHDAPPRGIITGACTHAIPSCEVRSCPARPAALHMAQQTIRASPPAQVHLVLRTTRERMEPFFLSRVLCTLQVSAGEARLLTTGTLQARRVLRKRYVVMRLACAFGIPTAPFSCTPHAPTGCLWLA